MAESQPAKQTCAYYLLGKKRHCKMAVVKGSEYCGQHLDTLLVVCVFVFVFQAVFVY